MSNDISSPQFQSTPPPTNAKLDIEAPCLGFIVASALTDGDVIGVYRDDNALELRWVDAMLHDQAPLTFSLKDLSRIEYLMYSARTLLESEGQ